MPNLGPSLEDLLDKEAALDDETTEGKLKAKIKKIDIEDKEKEKEKQATSIGLPYVNLVGFPIGPDALTLVDKELAKKLQVICFFNNGTEIRLGAVEQTEEIKEIEEQLKEKYHAHVQTYLITKNSFNTAIKLYDSLPEVRKMIKGVEIKEEELKKFEAEIKEFHQINDQINKVNISDVFVLILAAAINFRASDIHIEAEEHGIMVRLRIDGVLQEAAVIDREKWKRIISRLKVLAGVKINVDTRPQDGQFTIFLTKDKVDIRASFLPTAYGESVVMRLLRSESISLSFDDLGLMPNQYHILNQEIEKPNGLILTTGPTGSGKTTTLYAILSKLNQPETKIITLEDPIEYKLKGINQSQIDEKKGYTFAKGLRSILRQDPDIVLVGEIRDLETAEIAVQASLTGHLVLSTLHTNDASGVIPRLLDLGVQPFFIVPSINAVIGQRLVRKLCDKCKKEHILTEEESEMVKKILAVISSKANIEIPKDVSKVYIPVESDCEECNGVGYKGRIGIYEIFVMDDEIKQLTNDKAPAFKILQQAVENGMVTMLQDGVLKVLNGVTSLEEVYRVIGKFDYIEELYDIVISQTIGRGFKVSPAEMAKAEESAHDLKQGGLVIKDAPMSEMINLTMALALVANAGDIHIEPEENDVKIRFRIDGILQDIVDLPKDSYLQLLSKIKTLAGFPTNVKRASWDGRMAVFLEDKKIDCRISIISGGYGETIVIRVLSSQAAALKMEDLGIRPYTLEPLKKSMKKTKGVIITTGPTGSGKTTTLYSVLNQLNKPDVKIITVEDPIEYHLEGIIQTQIDVDEGYTFSVAMRSLLRQNPNIMMIGEIRDHETAEIVIEAATSGHLVLTTIHANSAAGAIARFVGLGIDRSMLASSMECSIGQRLVRRLCPYCKKEAALDGETENKVKDILAQINPASGVAIPTDLKFYQAVGCEKCNNIGYKGRIGLYELIEMTPELQKIIQTPMVVDNDIEQLAVTQGTLLMIHDGILKALEGETTIEEIFRVVL